ncbi:MAG: 23S rRNA (uracil(1939)-C(5))-methyltransferase RlmD [Gammaproteobacteria bacterium]|nr:23S rRNA (uracil(1939)-C(5))-methyltransferase RlmD [Gammaproteobacteria bacterium]
MTAKHNRLSAESLEVRIESLAEDGRGVAHAEGKAVLAVGGLPGERVRVCVTKRRRSYDEGRIEEVLEASPERVTPACPFFDLCGGCSLQHLAPERQIEHKQRWLLDALRRIGGVRPAEVLEPLRGPCWGYRRKARLGVKHVPGKGRVLVGFRERRSPYIVDMSRCEVLDSSVGRRLMELSDLLGSLDAKDRIPQIEVAVGDNAAALVFRHLAPLGHADLERIAGFGERTGVQVWLQPKGPDTAHPLWPPGAALWYRLEAFDVTIHFRPTDFAQINFDINRPMVESVLALLDPQADERVLDLFCGLGNFSLPLARKAGEVVGVEGEPSLIERARENARANGIGNLELHARDLDAELGGHRWAKARYDRILLDPPRPGAEAAVRTLGARGARRIVYVSCHPATLARDAGILIHEHGYGLERAGVMDMFPHTAHVESIAVFSR